MTTDGPAHRGGRGRHRRWARSVVVGVVAAAVVTVVAHPWSDSTIVRAQPVRPVSGTTRASATSTAPIPLDAAEFATGSCVALTPTAGNRRQTVFLDAGHGGPDPGAAQGTTDSGQHVLEKSVTLPVVLDTAQLLRARGYRVVLSRTTDSSVVRLTPADLDGPLLTTAGEHADLIARVDCADLAGASALVSVHFDAYPSRYVGGATTLYDTTRPFSPANQALAAALQQDIVTNLAAGGWPVPNRGITSDSTAGGGEITAAGTAYGHLDLLGPADPGHVDNPTTMPGALVEPLFLSNPAEATIAVNPAAQQAIAAGIVAALTQFLRAR